MSFTSSRKSKNDDSGRDGTGPDAVGAALHGQVPSHADHAHLGGCVGQSTEGAEGAPTGQ